jgi:hypothetical protein
MDNGLLVTILILVGLAALTLFILWRKKVKKAADSWKQGSFDRARAIMAEEPEFLTPKGYKVYFEKGAEPADFTFDAIDIGVEKTFEKCLCAEYNVDRSRHHIHVVVFNSIKAPESGIPAYKVFIGPGNFYYWSDWDMEKGKGQEVDHYILAAGETVGVGITYGDIIVVPSYGNDDNPEDLARVVEFEMEHVTLAYYDGDKYQETKFHGTGGHPLIPDCPSDVKAVNTAFAVDYMGEQQGVVK